MGKNGGTKIYCPFCEKITNCRAIPLNEIGKGKGQHFKTVTGGVGFFRRGRECFECYQVFSTSEIHEDLLHELLELSSLLDKVKDDVEQCSKDAKKTSSTLMTLSKYLKANKT